MRRETDLTPDRRRWSGRPLAAGVVALVLVARPAVPAPAGMMDVASALLARATTGIGYATTAHAAGSSVETLQAVVDDLRAQLSIPEAVEVAIVTRHPLLVSVERHDTRADGFLLRIERPFLDELTDVEIRAALAHELGHVWIFTHHPYLHTEALANRIALRVVSRGALAQVYQRMWARQGIEDDLARVIGPPAPSPEPAVTRATLSVGLEERNEPGDRSDRASLDGPATIDDTDLDR